ncbi:MAG: hypothetical protein ACR2HI_08720, partial [Gaiella sp.]
MRLRGTGLLFSPSDLNDFVECEHLTALELRRLRGQLELVEPPANPQADLVKEKGLRHEDAFLAALELEGKTVTRVEVDEERWDLERAAADTLDAMRAGVGVVSQA